jgi:hypothetical protein
MQDQDTAWQTQISADSQQVGLLGVGTGLREAALQVPSPCGVHTRPGALSGRETWSW